MTSSHRWFLIDIPCFLVNQKTGVNDNKNSPYKEVYCFCYQRGSKNLIVFVLLLYFPLVSIIRMYYEVYFWRNNLIIFYNFIKCVLFFFTENVFYKTILNIFTRTNCIPKIILSFKITKWSKFSKALSRVVIRQVTDRLSSVANGVTENKRLI